MKTISEQYAQELIDFAPTERAKAMGFAESQLHGAVAAFNMLHRNGLAYVADEVGMGKTYLAVGVMGLIRFQNPQARIVVIAPRENIQLKWIKELRNFVRDNWRCEDNRVKNLQGEPVWNPMACGSIGEIARTLRVSENIDLFLRSTTFSVAVRKHEGRQHCRNQLRPFVPWIKPRLLRSRDPSTFRDMYGRVLNAIVPDIDLLIVDEAHNFKHGFGENVSNRNRVLGLALGHPRGVDAECPWYGPRVKRLLLLSATPFEYDYADLYRQLDEFGFGDSRFRDSQGADPLDAPLLLDSDEETSREIIRRFLIRRVQYLKIAGEKHSKNMYRREWRLGGYERHDDPMALTDPKQRLIVGLIQKKVAEILGDRRFNNSFQIGMLSSFESFLETISRSKRTAESNGSEDEEGQTVFDGDQDATRNEKRGIDSHSLKSVVSSYRELFGRGLPHPKLDATAKHLSDAFNTGEKALIFVRRIATVTELKAKLDFYYDRWIERHMREMLPGLAPQIDRIFRRYDREKRGHEEPDGQDVAVDEQETVEAELAFDLEEDEGSTESFFAWFFRGEGPKNLLSGAAFQKNRLAIVSSAYATFFEDDHVSWLLDRPVDVVVKLARVTNREVKSLRAHLRRMAYSFLHERTTRRDGYPRLYVFEAYQYAGLRALAGSSTSLAPQARVILRERYELGLEAPDLDPPKGFPEPQESLGTKTFFTELVQHTDLRERLWPYDDTATFENQFREREQRRELLSAMARLGGAYVDLYLLAIGRLQSFDLRAATDLHRPEELLIGDYLKLLESQMSDTNGPQFNAYFELSAAADAFETLVAVNFPEVRDARMSEYATMFARALQHQEPVGRVFGGVNKRLVKQFRMPGYPLVLATTDVLQEGEDLHTFCRRVIHYGITWTPSAMEQRTGRVDRIGSLVQRELDGSDRTPQSDELIQVHYPHLADTVERLLVRRVLQRLNQFLRLIHKTAPTSAAQNSRLDVAREILQAESAVPRIVGLLESDFPVAPAWLKGEAMAQDIVRPDVPALEQHFYEACNLLASRLGIDVLETHKRRTFVGRAAVANLQLVSWEQRGTSTHYREQPFELVLKSQAVGDATLIRCISPVGSLDLKDDDIVDELYDLQRDHGMIRVCARFDMKHRRYDTTVETDRLFHVDTTQNEELEDMVVRTILAADRIEEALLPIDTRSDIWLAANREEGDDE